MIGPDGCDYISSLISRNVYITELVSLQHQTFTIHVHVLASMSYGVLTTSYGFLTTSYGVLTITYEVLTTSYDAAKNSLSSYCKSE